jgi:putative hydrolase of the HAD superfamily
MHDIEAVVFDFDGVLNRGYDAQGFIWQRFVERDLGFCGHAFAHAMFGDNFKPIAVGTRDLRDVLDEVLPVLGARCSTAEMMAYWFAQDLEPCAELLAFIDNLRAHGIRCVLGTNNERHRAAYIWDNLLKDRMDGLFTSGLMGVAKPDAAFYLAVQDALGCSPERILFIDDIAENVAAAQALGWRAVQYGDHAAGRLGHPQDIRRLFPVFLNAA